MLNSLKTRQSLQELVWCCTTKGLCKQTRGLRLVCTSFVAKIYRIKNILFKSSALAFPQTRLPQRWHWTRWPGKGWNWLIVTHQGTGESTAISEYAQTQYADSKLTAQASISCKEMATRFISFRSKAQALYRGILHVVNCYLLNFRAVTIMPQDIHDVCHHYEGDYCTKGRAVK